MLELFIYLVFAGIGVTAIENSDHVAIITDKTPLITVQSIQPEQRVFENHLTGDIELINK